ncbi:MAG TPA: SBBP repeat-containing protein [Pyrinomonadaceae bacterium]|nr:SBBP repeat-containing protein [Pyrinomonadaceae bacterium]
MPTKMKEDLSYLPNAIIVLTLVILALSISLVIFGHLEYQLESSLITTVNTSSNYTSQPSLPASTSAMRIVDESTQMRVSESYGRLPLSFEANRGQTESQVKFLSRGSGYSLFLTSTEAVLALRKANVGSGDANSDVLRMKLVGANPQPPVTGLDELPGKVNYFIGSDPKKWRTDVPTYARVKYRDVYRGIDLIYYGNQRQLEYDFVVEPGADPNIITLGFEGADKLDVSAEGDLVMQTAGGEIRQHKPTVYQEVGGVRQEISSTYVLIDKHRVGFRVGTYDANRPLVIDPVIVYSTFLGGGGSDQALDIAVDSEGNAYVTGGTNSLNFPIANAFQPVFGSGPPGGGDAFVAKLDPTGSVLMYSTYLGGTDGDSAAGIAADTNGNAYITGETLSGNFPVANPLFPSGCADGRFNAYVTKLNPAGSALLYSTCIQNSSGRGRSVAVDSIGNAYVTGDTSSTTFPRVNAFQSIYGGATDAFVLKLNTVGSALIYSTYFGGSAVEIGNNIAVDPFGNSYITGETRSTNLPTTPGAFQITHGGGTRDTFVAGFNPAGSSLVYSTYLGGTADEIGAGIATDSAGNAYVTGTTLSSNFPTTPGAFQTALSPGGFVCKFNSIGSLIYSTYFERLSNARDVAVNSLGEAYVTGNSHEDAFLVKLNATGSAAMFFIKLAGINSDEGNGVSVDILGNVYISGVTNSSNFPTMNPLQSTFAGGNADAFVAKIFDQPPNQQPVANAGGPYTVGEGFSVTLVASGSDPDADPLTYDWDLDNNGSFETAGQTPTFSAVGRDGPSSQTVVLRVCDDKSACATSTTTVDVTNVPPTANNDSATTNEDTSVTINVIANDADVPADPLTVTSVASSSFNGGTAVLNGDNTVTYTPALNFSGTDNFTYTISDSDGGTATAMVTVTVNPVNDAPVSNVPGPQSTSPNSALIFSIINGNPISIADVDAGSAAVQATLTTTNGILALSTTAGLTFTTGDGTADTTMTFTGSIAAINAAIDGLRYDPAAGFSGVASVSITTNDLGNSGAGGPLSDTDTVLVTVSTSATVDLMLTASATPDPVVVGSSLIYTLSVANIGAFTATGITLSNDLPNSLNFVSATSSQGVGCTREGNTVTCRLGALVSGASATVTIVATPTRPGVIVNRASVAANETDSDPANNRAVTQSRVN